MVWSVGVFVAIQMHGLAASPVRVFLPHVPLRLLLEPAGRSLPAGDAAELAAVGMACVRLIV
jgi:hypothetical protein